MAKKFISTTIVALNKYLFDKESGLFNLHYNIKNKAVDSTKTTFANAHCAYCLHELGYKNQATTIPKAALNSKLFDRKKYLFRFSIKDGKILDSDKNGCSNLLMIKALATSGFKEEAFKLYNATFDTLFNKKYGLFVRSTKDKELLVAQTNLWGVTALEAIDMKKEAKELLDAIIENFYNKERGLLISRSSTKKGKYKFSFIFSDDNLLFCWVGKKYYLSLCKSITKKALESSLFDKKKNLFNRSLRIEDNFLNEDKSTYKNAICLLGLKTLRYPYAKKLEQAIVTNLYNKKVKLFMDCFSDSNALACYALNY